MPFKTKDLEAYCLRLCDLYLWIEKETRKEKREIKPEEVEGNKKTSIPFSFVIKFYVLYIDYLSSNSF